MAVDLAMVAMGGALGSLARYGISSGAARLLGKGFPWGTLAVNVLGCFAMGVVIQLLLGLESRGPAVSESRLAFWRQGVAIGFLGGLTTFSSFGGDTLRQWMAQEPAAAVANIAANVILSLAAVWCGLLMAQAAT